MQRRSFLILPFLVTPAHAHSYDAGGIKIGHAWALPAPMGIDGQVFMPLLNTGKAPDSLVAARSDICSIIETRMHSNYDRLAPQEFYLEPNKPFAMRPTSKHLRLMGLKMPLVLGEKFSLVLDFLHAGEVEVEVHVENSPGD
jgi:periplasmic copper chaperone A